MTARSKIAQIVSDTTNKAFLTATAELRARLLEDETVRTVANLEPVPLDVKKVVDAAIKDAGGDEVRLPVMKALDEIAGVLLYNHWLLTCSSGVLAGGVCSRADDRTRQDRADRVGHDQ